MRAGAGAVLVAQRRAELTPWWQAHRASRLLVIRATDQLVHTPLVAPLVASGHARAIAVAPDGAYGGAMIARGAAADALVAALAGGADDRELASASGGGAATVPHGPLARHDARTPAERRAAARLLYRIIHKPQDNAITRWLFRPASFALTRLLVHTPITPNQITFITAILVAVGCWLTAQPTPGGAIGGSALVLAAAYTDCCDGEVARLKLMSSRLGAWFDTIVDELSQIAYLVALGLHCRAHFNLIEALAPSWPHRWDMLDGSDPWRWAIALGVATYGITIACVYWNIVVVVGSANSQDYVGRFEIADGDVPGTARLRPIASQAIATSPDHHPALRWIATYVPHVVRKDFVCWAMVLLAVLQMTQLAFILLVTGGVVSSAIVAVDHVRVRRQLGEIRRRARVFVRATRRA